MRVGHKRLLNTVTAGRVFRNLINPALLAELAPALTQPPGRWCRPHGSASSQRPELSK